MIIIDSGLGGISVVRALRKTQPGLALTYVADTAAFPYGDRSAEDLNARAGDLVRAALKKQVATTIVLACNTLSTLCLAPLREVFADLQFVGTVPAIKIAAQRSATRRFTLLATPNTAHSAYTNDLIAEFAGDCIVDCYGAPKLAAIAEHGLLNGGLQGEEINLVDVRMELKPAFHAVGGATDCIVLGCTHYPLILDALRMAAPWPVEWIDSSEAIARRAVPYADAAPAKSVAYITSDSDMARYERAFLAEGFDAVELLS